MTNVETSRMTVPGTKLGPKQTHEKIDEHLGLPAQPEEEGKKNKNGLAQDNNPCNFPPPA